MRLSSRRMSAVVAVLRCPVFSLPETLAEIKLQVIVCQLSSLVYLVFSSSRADLQSVRARRVWVTLFVNIKRHHRRPQLLRKRVELSAGIAWIRLVVRGPRRASKLESSSQSSAADETIRGGLELCRGLACRLRQALKSRSSHFDRGRLWKV